MTKNHTFTPAQSSQVSTLAKLADKWRVQAKQYDEAAKECYYRGDDDEGDMNDIEGSALFRCATELDTALKSLASQPPAAPVTFQQSELKSAATVETDHRGSSAETSDLVERVVEVITEWVGETPHEHAVAAAKEAIAVIRAQPQEAQETKGDLCDGK